MAGRRHPLRVVRLPSGHRPVVVAATTARGRVRRYTRRVMPEETPDARLESGFRLGEWTARPAQNRLVSPKRTRHLEPRAMDLLCALAFRQGRVVDKDTLIDEVWEGRIISEGTLSNTVAELRQALDDDARSPRFIETIPKRGYRLMVAVEPVGATAAHAPARKFWLWTAIAAVAAGVAGLVFLAWPRAEPPPPRAVDLLPSVRVEPFADRTERPDLVSLAPMATDWVIQGLVDTGLVRVIRGAGTGPADLVVTGTCYVEGDTCSCRADVARSDGTLLAALDPPSAPEPAGVVEAIRQAVSGAVATRLGAHAHSQLLLSRPPRFDAWQEFIAGSLLFGKDTAGAVRHLERAAELDPGFFSARLRLAFGYRGLGKAQLATATLAALDAERDRRTPFERLWLDAAKALFGRQHGAALLAFRRLQRVLPNDMALHHLVGGCALSLNRPEEALREYEKMDYAALDDLFRQAGISASMISNHAFALQQLGRYREALAVVEQARAVLPASPHLDAAELTARAALGEVAEIERLLDGRLVETPNGPNRGELLLLAARTLRAFGHRETSLDLANRSVSWLRHEGSDDSALPLLAESLAYAERWGEAEAVLRKLLTAQPDDPHLLGWLAVVAGRQGDRDTVRDVEARFASIDGSAAAGWSTFWHAVAVAESGNAPRTADLLAQATREGWGSWWRISGSMLLEPVRDDPRMQEVLRPRG